MVGFFFKYGNICLYNARVCTHTLFKQRKVRQIDVQAQKLSKMTKKCPKCSFRAFEGPSRVVFFQDIGMSAYVVHKCIHIHYLNKEKFAQIKLLAQKQSKTVKNDKKMLKMLIQGLGGTLCPYFVVVKPPSSFSSQKMDMVGQFLHQVL